MHPQIDNRDAQYVVEPYQSASNSYILVRAPPVVPKVITSITSRIFLCQTYFGQN